MSRQHPRWQKARFLEIPSIPHLSGKFVWAENTAPACIVGEMSDGEVDAYSQKVRVNSETWDTVKFAQYVVTYPSVLERYPEFTDEAEIVPFHVWSDPRWPGEAPPFAS